MRKKKKKNTLKIGEGVDWWIRSPEEGRRSYAIYWLCLVILTCELPAWCSWLELEQEQETFFNCQEVGLAVGCVLIGRPRGKNAVTQLGEEG